MDGDVAAQREALSAPSTGFQREGLHLASSDDVDLGSSREFCVNVCNEMVGAALSFVGSNGGWTPRRTIGADTFVVTDVAPARTVVERSSRCVLVLESSPFAAQLALRSLSRGRVMAAFTVDEPRFLLPALESLRQRHAMVPASVFELASLMPELSVRQLDILAALTAGLSNRDIAKGIYLSEASVKREIAVLFQLFDVASRLALAARATELGIRQRRPLT